MPMITNEKKRNVKFTMLICCNIIIA